MHHLTGIRSILVIEVILVQTEVIGILILVRPHHVEPHADEAYQYHGADRHHERAVDDAVDAGQLRWSRAVVVEAELRLSARVHHDAEAVVRGLHHTASQQKMLLRQRHSSADVSDR